MTAVTYGYKLLKKVVSLKLKYVKEKLRIHFTKITQKS